MNQLIAVAQMRSGNDLDANFDTVMRLCEHAKDRGAELVCFPENFAYMPKNQADGSKIAEPLNGPLFSRYKGLAQKFGLQISFGGFQEQASQGRVFNSHVLVNTAGQIAAVYRKIHLFVVSINDETNFNEAAHVEPGNDLVVCNSAVGQTGLSICYDVRFAELYAALRRRGADVLLVPAAFTAETGKAHWEVLLRARAIENQCYMAAAAQYGFHHKGRTTHGHAMIVDPWGTVVAQCTDVEEGLAFAEIDHSYLNKVRTAMPVAFHRRPELFS